MKTITSSAAATTHPIFSFSRIVELFIFQRSYLLSIPVKARPWACGFIEITRIFRRYAPLRRALSDSEESGFFTPLFRCEKTAEWSLCPFTFFKVLQTLSHLL